MSYNIEQIREIAPSVFTTEKASHLSDKYIQTPTIRVVEDLMNLWLLVLPCYINSLKTFQTC